jgi:hypothetical protein
VLDFGVIPARLSPVETRRWTNPSQPQTLYLAHMLLYFMAAFSLIFDFMNGSPYVTFMFGGFALVVILVFVASAAFGAYGIANERKWGYRLGIAAVVLRLLPNAWYLMHHFNALFNVWFLLDVVFPVALLLLLVHPMSRDYERIWFK